MNSIEPILIAFLVILFIWGMYLLPHLRGGRREAPIASTERFDQWTHVMAEVQRRDQPSVRTKEAVRSRRRRSLVALVGLALLTVAAALVSWSLNWLLANLAVDAVLAWYVGMLLQVKQREASKVAVRHLATRSTEADAPPVRIVAGN
jgi:membrane glycosyltransferase